MQEQYIQTCPAEANRLSFTSFSGYVNTFTTYQRRHGKSYATKPTGKSKTDNRDISVNPNKNGRIYHPSQLVKPDDMPNLGPGVLERWNEEHYRQMHEMSHGKSKRGMQAGLQFGNIFTSPYTGQHYPKRKWGVISRHAGIYCPPGSAAKHLSEIQFRDFSLVSDPPDKKATLAQRSKQGPQKPINAELSHNTTPLPSPLRGQSLTMSIIDETDQNITPSAAIKGPDWKEYQRGEQGKLLYNPTHPVFTAKDLSILANALGKRGKAIHNYVMHPKAAKALKELEEDDRSS